MSLRSRLFLFFGGLIAALAGAEWWLVHSLTRDLESEVGQVALEVGSSVASLFVQDETAQNIHVGHNVIAIEGGGLEHLGEGAGLLGNGRHLEIHFKAKGVGEPGGPWHNVEIQEEVRLERLDLGRGLQHGEAGESLFDVVLADPTGARVGRRVALGAFFDPTHVMRIEQLLPDDAPLRPNDAPLARVPIPEEGYDAAVARFRSRLLLGSAGILGLALCIAGFAAHRVAVPLRGLARAAREVEAGALGFQAPAGSGQEVTETIAAFNSMSTRLEDLNKQAETLRRREHLTELGDVARGLAHSLRNPLNVLGLTVEELSAGTTEKNGDLAANARAQIQRIDRTLRTFLSLSSGGGNEVARVEVDDLARDVALELLQDVTRDVQVRVESEAGPLAVQAVAPELRAVVHVLMVNAVEASADGDEVLCRLSAVAGGVCVEVEDAGPGVPDTVREHLFTPHTTTKEQGAGMGLYLAHRIATSRYGGSLTLHDREQDGLPGRRGTRAVLFVSERRTENGASRIG